MPLSWKPPFRKVPRDMTSRQRLVDPSGAPTVAARVAVVVVTACAALAGFVAYPDGERASAGGDQAAPGTRLAAEAPAAKARLSGVAALPALRRPAPRRPAPRRAPRRAPVTTSRPAPATAPSETAVQEEAPVATGAPVTTAPPAATAPPARTAPAPAPAPAPPEPEPAPPETFDSSG
jgi:hypothetical protein